MRVLICPDKFKGTASAAEVARAMALAVERRGWEAVLAARWPTAARARSTRSAAPNRASTVTGPLGAPVRASWRLDGDLAVIEAAECAGLVLAGGPAGNRPARGHHPGVGELLAGGRRRRGPPGAGHRGRGRHDRRRQRRLRRRSGRRRRTASTCRSPAT